LANNNNNINKLHSREKQEQQEPRSDLYGPFWTSQLKLHNPKTRDQSYQIGPRPVTLFTIPDPYLLGFRVGSREQKDL
jgi:hypothetical protein